MAKLIVVYWRDIPSQVIGKRGRTSLKIKLSHRFQAAINRAAMRAGKGGSELYLSDWRREISTCAPDLESVTKAKAAELEQCYGEERLQLLVKSKGIADPTSATIATNSQEDG